MKALTERQAAVLEYVVEHPGCTTPEIIEAINEGVNPYVTWQAGLEAANSLYARRLLERRMSMLRNQPTRWYPEPAALAIPASPSGRR